MTVTTYSAALRDAVVAAVRGSLASFAEAHRGEKLAGYALVTEDGLTCLGYLGVTEEFLAPISDGKYTRYCAVDWPCSEGTEALDGACALMVADYERRASDGFAEHVNESYAALVNALEILRREGVFPGDVFVDVLSTDPSAHLERLEDAAVRLLNVPALYAEWREVMHAGSCSTTPEGAG